MIKSLKVTGLEESVLWVCNLLTVVRIKEFEIFVAMDHFRLKQLVPGTTGPGDGAAPHLHPKKSLNP